MQIMYFSTMKDIITLIVPKDILEHFSYHDYHESGGVYIIELVEKDDVKHIPKAILRQGKYALNGYMNPIELQTYPLQGKEVFLRLTRRKWKVQGTTRSYSNEYNFNLPGMKATIDFGVFLKEIGRG